MLNLITLTTVYIAQSKTTELKEKELYVERTFLTSVRTITTRKLLKALQLVYKVSTPSEPAP